MLPAYLGGMKKKEALERARALLDEVDMGHRVEHYPSALSGGERQRTAVARALVNEPALLLADEPTGNLDAEHAGMVSGLLFQEARKHNKTLIVVTHDDKIAAQAARRYSLSDGILQEQA
jgi:lipoprotein-releasing system ATP-binding protein